MAVRCQGGLTVFCSILHFSRRLPIANFSAHVFVIFPIFFVKVYLEANFEQNHGEMPAVLVLSNFCGILVLTNFCGILDFFRYFRVVNSDFRRIAETVSPRGQVIRRIASDVRDHSYNLSSFQCKVYISRNNPGHYCMDVKMSKGNVIPSLNGSQLYSSHPKQKCTKIYPEETAPGPRPLPYMGKILTFDRKVVEDPSFYQNDRI